MSKDKIIVVLGCNGQLGQSLQAVIQNISAYDVKWLDRASIDLTDLDSITHYFAQNNCDVIINCAAYTAVDKAESEPEMADIINFQAVKKLAEIAKVNHIKLIHISTDYVFNGQQFRPYIETDKVAPQSVYGETKFKGEQALLNIMPNNAIIIRTSWLYSEFSNNFVKTMLKLAQQRDSLKVIFDQIGTPTYANDLAQAIMVIVQSERFNQTSLPSELYHYSNEGVCSWYDFSKAIFELTAIDCRVSPIETKDYPTAAARPHYSLLNKTKIKREYNLSIPYWKDSLAQCISNIKP